MEKKKLTIQIDGISQITLKKVFDDFVVPGIKAEIRDVLKKHLSEVVSEEFAKLRGRIKTLETQVRNLGKK